MVRNTVEEELTVIFKEFLSDQVLKTSPLSRNAQHSTSENHIFVFNSERETESQPTPLFSFKIISEKLFKNISEKSSGQTTSLFEHS